MMSFCRAPVINSICRTSSNSFRYIQVTSARHVIGFSELAGAIGEHPTIVAVTGGGGVGLAAALYRSPQLWKMIAKATSDHSILLLPPKPSHDYQSRAQDIEELQSMMKSLIRQNKGGISQTIYITGQPGYGKTQLARELAKKYFRKKKGFFFRKLFVGTLNASSRSTFIHSYVNIAMELGCMSELRSLKQLTGSPGELQSLEFLSNAVRKELRRRSGWLLIVDNLNRWDSLVPESGISFYESGYSLAPKAPVSETLSLPGTLSPGLLNVGVSYGVPPVASNLNQYWPQPGSEEWGRGIVMVTTHDRRLVETASPFVKELFLKEGMNEQDAITLLQKVSGCHGDGCQQLVDILDRVPLAIASAGFYISSERSRNPQYGFEDYLRGIEKGVQEESEKMLTSQNRSYPVTMTMAVVMAAKQLAVDPNLEKVFMLLVCCAHGPVPMSLIARVLGMRPDINSTVLESIRQCVLLQVTPESSTNDVVNERTESLGMVDVECVSLYRGTRDMFREVFLGDNLSAADSEHSVTMETSLPANQNHFTMIRHIIDCLISEYESAKDNETIQSYRLQHLLIPHLEIMSKGRTLSSGFRQDPEREVKLLHSLGDAYLLKGKSQQARTVLEKGLSILEESGEGKSLKAAQLATRLGVTYRQLGLLKESEFTMREALSVLEQKIGEWSMEVGGVLTLLSHTLKSLGKYHESRECLEKSLDIFESLFGDEDIRVATVLTHLGSTWRSLGDSKTSKRLFERALSIQQDVLEPLHPSIAVTLGSLGIVYNDIGNPLKSIELLNQALNINKHVHGSDHISVAITLSQMSNAYRHLGDMTNSITHARQALDITKSIHGPVHPGVAIALGILGSTYFEMGEFSQSHDLLNSSVTINRTVYGDHHTNTATAQTQLGNILRYLGGQLRDSKDLLETSLTTKEKILEPNHPSLAVTLNALGKIYHELGYLTKSLVCMKRSMNILKCLYPSHHPQMAFIEADLARVLRDTGQLEFSGQTMQTAINKYLNIINGGFAKSHPKFASMLAINGLIWRDLNELHQAKRFLLDGLELQEKILSSQNLMKAETLCNLGTVYHRLGFTTKSREHFNMSLNMLNHVGVAHPLKSTVLIAIGHLLADNGDVYSGRVSLKAGLKIRQQACGTIRSNIAYYHRLLGADHTHSGNIQSHHLKEATRIYSLLIKREKELSRNNGFEIPVLDDWENEIKDINKLIYDN